MFIVITYIYFWFVQCFLCLKYVLVTDWWSKQLEIVINKNHNQEKIFYSINRQSSYICMRGCGNLKRSVLVSFLSDHKFVRQSATIFYEPYQKQ